MSEQKDDGVNREGLDYRAGWVEACRAFAQAINLESVRAKKTQLPGLELAHEISRKMYNDMLETMRNAGK